MCTYNRFLFFFLTLSLPLCVSSLFMFIYSFGLIFLVHGQVECFCFSLEMISFFIFLFLRLLVCSWEIFVECSFLIVLFHSFAQYVVFGRDRMRASDSRDDQQASYCLTMMMTTTTRNNRLGVIIIEKCGHQTLPSNNKPIGNQSWRGWKKKPKQTNKNVDSILINAHGKYIKRNEKNRKKLWCINRWCAIRNTSIDGSKRERGPRRANKTNCKKRKI